MNNEMNVFTMTWFIENYSYCWHKNGEFLNSPQFTADNLKDTVWYLQLFPRGYRDGDRGYISLYLKRSGDDDGPDGFTLKYELTFLSADGSSLSSRELERTFKKRNGIGWNRFFKMDELLLKKADFLPQDTLSVRCKLWDAQPVTYISIRTRIGIEHYSFLHAIEDFSSLKSNQKKMVQIGSSSTKGLAFSSTLYLTDCPCCEEKVIIEFTPKETNQILSKCKLFLLDRTNRKMECGEADNRFDGTKRDVQKLSLSLSKQEIVNRKSELLPNDKLSLLCECTFSTGVEFQKIESILHEKSFMHTNKNESNHEKNLNKFKLSTCPSALDDFKGVYNDQLFSDIELKTKTKSFPAHKIVICARSPVFRAMMTNDMKEKKDNLILVDDLEDDIVHQLLLFLYSDTIENLQWNSAIKLYYAGDKYAVEKLKMLCAAFLANNLSICNASELLLLAETHNDSDLLKVVEDFIFKHEEQVFGSKEWEQLTESYPLLVSKTMLLKYKRKL